MTHSLFVPPEVSGLQPFVGAGVLGPTEVHAVATFARVTGESSLEVLLAAALAVRAPQHGHVCVDLDTVRDTVVTSLESSAQVSTDGQPDSPAATDDALDAQADHRGDQAPEVVELPWPQAHGWLDRIAASPLVRVMAQSGRSAPPPPTSRGELTPLVVDAGRLYLARYWALERYVAADLLARSSAARPGATPADGSDPSGGREATAVAEIERVFKAAGGPVDGDQLAAAVAGASQDLVVISGGPGTGKTTTVARFLAGLVSALEQSGSDLRIALVAPTGKAAARMTEAVRHAVDSLSDVLDVGVAGALGKLEATTIHRLLGQSRGPGFRHGPDNPVPHDIVIVDEVSMVSLSLMAHLLAAVRAEAKVVLVGDPYQLASVEAGAVLGDIVGLDAPGSGLAGSAPPPLLSSSVRVLGTVHRQAEGSNIRDLATAIRTGDADAAIGLLRAGHRDLRWIDPADPDRQSDLRELENDVAAVAASAVSAARDHRIDDALNAINEVKVLCALRRGPSGVDGWNQRIEYRLRKRKLIARDDWYDGRPVMVTENDYLNRVFNGDVGVAIRGDERFEVWFPRAEGNQMVESARLDRIATQWAMSIHKSQGSEFSHVVVTLPAPGSRILTRELLYTAVTRAKSRLTIVAPAESITTSIQRPVARASGLAARLATGTVSAGA